MPIITEWFRVLSETQLVLPDWSGQVQVPDLTEKTRPSGHVSADSRPAAQ